MTLTFTCSKLPPSVNHCYENRWQGGKKLTREAEAWMKLMFYDLIMTSGSGISFPITEKVFLEVAVWMPDRRVRDMDNFGKVLFDGLQRKGILENDGQIRDLRIYDAGIDREHPRMDITLGSLAERKIA